MLNISKTQNAVKTAICLSATMLLSFPSQDCFASKDLGNGFTDHGVATPISNHRGTVCTVDGNGDNVVLQWIMDHRGGYAVLMVNAEKGGAEQFPIPFENVLKDSPFASILSSTNKFYTHFGDHFVEFDPIKPGFTFSEKTATQMSMGMTEDDNGVIWSATYPQSGIVAFNPKTREFRDFGHVYKQNWPQYQRYIAADDTGHIYFAIGSTASQIVALDPATSTATAILPEAERTKGTAYVFRSMNGKVYGKANKEEGDSWYELYKGEARKVSEIDERAKPYISGSQALTHASFPDGSKLLACDLVERKVSVTDPSSTGTSRTLAFDYTSDGALIMGLAKAPDNTICGGTCFPMRFFSYDPKTDKITNRAAYGQWNTITALKDKFYVGGYPGGFLLEWLPSKDWVPTDSRKASSNPRFIDKVSPVIHRPHALLAMADQNTVVMGGTPAYGYTGGGLVFWDRASSSSTVIKDTDIIPDQAPFSLIELPGNKILGGTTTEAGTGGEQKANLAELFIMDASTKKMEWHAPLIKGAQGYIDLCEAPEGNIYGFADKKTFFVFDPVKRSIIHQADVSVELGNTVSDQGPRIFVPVGEKVYVIFEKGIAAVDHATFEIKLLAESPVKIQTGGDYLDGRIYFGTPSHIGSYDLNTAAK